MPSGFAHSASIKLHSYSIGQRGEKARKLIFKPNLEHLKRKSAAAAASRCKCADDDRQITQIEQIADPQIARS